MTANLLTLSVLCYVFACVTPCIEDCLGFHALVWGWLAGYGAIAWCANPLLLIGWFCIGGRFHLTACLIGVLATWLGLVTVLVFHDELRFGYALWQASLALFAVAAFRRFAQARSVPANDEGISPI